MNRGTGGSKVRKLTNFIFLFFFWKFLNGIDKYRAISFDKIGFNLISELRIFLKKKKKLSLRF